MGFIYKAVNKVNGKIYIGQTRCSISKRWNEHIRASRTTERDFKLHRAIRKYGEDNFEVSVVDKVPDELLNRSEINYISKYDSYTNGYNSTIGGDGSSKIDRRRIRDLWDDGLTITEIAHSADCSKQTVHAVLKDYPLHSNEESIYRGKRNQMVRVNQYDLDGNFIQSFESTASAARSYGVDRTLISTVCRQKRPSGAGYIWRYAR